MDKLNFYINGEWVKPSENKTLDVINPATEMRCGNNFIGLFGRCEFGGQFS